MELVGVIFSFLLFLLPSKGSKSLVTFGMMVQNPEQYYLTVIEFYFGDPTVLESRSPHLHCHVASFTDCPILYLSENLLGSGGVG